MDEDGEDVGERTSGPIRPLFFTLGNFGWTVREGGATRAPWVPLVLLVLLVPLWVPLVPLVPLVLLVPVVPD